MKKIEKFMGEITNLSVPIRYPQNFQRMVKDFSKERAEDMLIKTKKVF